MLNGKVAVITGGTRGIGFAIVKKYLENGAKVIFTGSRDETVNKALARLKDEDENYQVEGMVIDLVDPNDIARAFKDIVARYKSLDILVNNAGISHRDRIYDYDPKDFKNIMDINVNAIFYTSQAAAKIMKEQGGGVILNASSMVGTYGQPSGVGYPTSKFAVNGITKSLARELGPDNIRVNAVSPGIVSTETVRSIPKELTQPIVDAIPLRRIGEPEDIANAYLFLASDLASYITGETLCVDGCART